MKLDRTKHNKFATGAIYGNTTSGGITPSSSTAPVVGGGGSTVIIQGGGGSQEPVELGLGDLTNVGTWANEAATEDRFLVQVEGSNQWIAKPISDIIGDGEGNAYNKLDNDYFDKLFVAIDANGNEIDPNDSTTEIASIKARYGFWTEHFISVKGTSGDSGTDNTPYSHLRELQDVRLSQPVYNGQMLVYRNGYWVNETVQTGGSVSDEDLKDYAKKSYVDEKLDEKVDNAFFLRVFGIIGENDEEIPANDVSSTIKSIQVKFGLWTNEFLSAIGLNPAEGEMSITLKSLNDVKISDIQAGESLVWNGSYWVNQLIEGGGIDEEALEEYLNQKDYATNTDVISALSSYATIALVNTKVDSSTFNSTVERIDNDLEDAFVDLNTKATKEQLSAVSSDLDEFKTETNTNINNLQSDISELDNNKLNVDYFQALFGLIDSNDTEVTPNTEIPETIKGIKAKFGLWTEEYLSALGMNPANGEISLTLASLNDVQFSELTEGQSIVWNGTKWINKLIESGLNESALAEYLTNNNYAKKSDIPSLSGYATEQWVLGKGYATTSDLDSRIDALVNGAPAAYDTLKEIADVLAGNVNSISDILTALGNKADKATTLSGYGIADAYTITQIDNIVNGLSGNISTLQGYFTDGVANSAKKLTTARTIWGQSFNGENDIDGVLKMKNGAGSGVSIADSSGNYVSSLYLSSTNNFYIGDGMGTRGYNTYIRGNAIRLTYGTSNTLGFILNSSGDVGIGAASPSYKLDVNGTTRTTKLVIGNGSIEWDATNNGFKVTGGLYTESYLSAKGANSSGGSSSGGGLITSLYRYADLGKTFSDTNNDTFNAYTINKINTDLGSRISVLEGKATNVTYTANQISGTLLGTLTIDGASKNIYAPTIPTDDINKGVTAYGWGNHASVGYITASASITGNAATASQLKTILFEDGGDLNNYYSSSYHGILYYINSSISALNSPFSTCGLLFIRSAGGSYTTQLAFSSAGELAMRRITSSVQGSWRTILHSENYDDYTYSKSTIDTKLSGYLPLSGGTITGSSAKILNIKRTSNNPVIAYYANDTLVGFLGINTDKEPIFTDSNGSTWKLIHSGNIGSYAMKVNPVNINLETDTNVAGYGQTADGWPVAGPALLLSNSVGNYAMMLSGRNGVLRFNTREAGNLTGWKTIAFTDSNVASATKLATARTIWGQPFDGTRNVSGALKLPIESAIECEGYDLLRLASSYDLTIGYGVAGNGRNTYISGNNVYLRYGTSRSTGITLAATGDVGIGAASPSYKLDVNGSLHASGAVSFDSTLNVTGQTTLSSVVEMGSAVRMVNAKYLYGRTNENVLHNILGINGSNVLLVNYGAVDRNVKAWLYGNEFRFNLYTDGAAKGTLAWIDSKLGVGTSTPEYTADIRGTLRTTLQAIIESSLEVTSKITLSGTTASTANIAFSRSSYNYITFPTDGSLCLSTATSTSGIVLRVTSTAIEPMTTATKSVGTSSKRWGAIYGVDGDFSGTLHATTGIYSDGYVSAKGQNTSSDMRLKNVLNDVVLGVKDIANAPSVRFAWKNGGGVDVGSSAQYWQKLLPDAVKERDGMLEMQYANIALLSAIAIAKNVETHEERIARLERENKELRNEINMMKGGYL